MLLVMSVHTGFGGQPFIPEVLDKARAAREAIDERGLAVEIEIDGGITSRPRPWPRPRASTSSSPAPRSSASPTRPPRRALRGVAEAATSRF